VPRRTIPACAGSTGGEDIHRRDGRDHPRVRGEHAVTNALVPASGGPSPRARGARPLDNNGCIRYGTIPACAGSTAGRLAAAGGRRDHPRVRGEHVATSQLLPVAGGTIPACAGSTLSDLGGYPA